MNEIDQVLKEMDFSFLGSGKHSMSVDGMRKALGDEHFVFLDVRTNEEQKYCVLPFALHIPLHELPDRLTEIPQDKFIITFCSSVFRGAMAFVYLRSKGFAEVKCMTANIEDMMAAFKPGPLAKMLG